MKWGETLGAGKISIPAKGRMLGTIYKKVPAKSVKSSLGEDFTSGGSKIKFYLVNLLDPSPSQLHPNGLVFLRGNFGLCDVK